MRRIYPTRKWMIIVLILLGTMLAMLMLSQRGTTGTDRKVDSFKGVAVYDNGADYTQSHGKNYSPDGYYYGNKWQCVEFVKRYYYQVKKHRLPDLFGNARDFYDPTVPQGGMNYLRGLIQYRNGGNMKPQVDDVLVFTYSQYGHVAIVTEVYSDCIEIIQQNVASGTRQKIKLESRKGQYYLGNGREPAAWLRKE